MLATNKQFKDKKGSILIYNVVIIFIFSLVMLGLLSYATIQLKVIRGSVTNEVAFQIAEAGVNYYQWHLAHFANDFWDGNASTTPGPYVHDFLDKDTNQLLGRYSLEITPPTVGSTIVTIKSVGYSMQNPLQKRSITVRYGVPSLAQYAFLTNGDAWIGDTESISGQFHSNGGLRFDGTGNSPIESSKSTYTCQSWSGSPCPATKPGIWGAAPQSTKNFWQFPVPNVDFSSMTSDLATLKSKAQSAGIYLPNSTKQGYSLVFKNNGTVDVYKVDSLKTSQPNGTDVNGVTQTKSTDYNGRTFQFNSAIPANGIIYVEDNTWVEGIVRGRAMVVAAKLPYNAASAPDILIPNSIVYTARDGTDSLGLLSQQDILLTYTSPSVLEIDAAMIAQNGSAQRYSWPGNIKTSIVIYGSVGSFGTWTWSWVDGGGNTTSGYTSTNTIYDSNLLYAPPPSFPLTSNGYQQISWSSN